VKLVFDHFKWDKIAIIGHSMGALVGILFTSLFPKRVEKLVSLDILSHFPFSAQQILPRIARNLNDLQKILLRMEDEPSTHTYQEARDRLIKGYKNSITEKDADILLIRGLVKKDDNKYYFSRDLRTNISTFLPFTAVQVQEMARNICCPFLLILAKGNAYHHNVEPDRELLDIYRSASADFRYVEVNGKHHVHLSQPDVVLPHIVDFLYPKRNPKSNL
jgi:pimeloyl-ACP methyl ester carboxylesterase